MTSLFLRLAALLFLLSSGCATTTPVHYADLHGLHMYFEDRGEGPPLLLLHGGGSTAQTSFGAIMPALARTHRLIAPEQQAHGHTADIDRPLSFEQMADDTAALLDRLGVARTDVLAFSNGSVVALQLAIRHPEKVRRLVLCSGFYARWGFPPGFWEGFAHATPDVMPAPLREAMAAALPDPSTFPRVFARQVGLMQSFTDLPEDALRAISAPALVMVGDRDVMSVEHSAKMAKLLPHGELAVLPGAEHGAYIGAAESARPGSELPKVSVSLIEAFLCGQ